MKKLIFFASALLCTCILCLGGCSNNNSCYSLECTFYEGETLVSDVEVVVIGVKSDIKSVNGKVKIENLNEGDIISFIKDGYLINKTVKIPVEEVNVDVYVFPVKEEVTVSSNVSDLAYAIQELEDDKFKITVVMPVNYVFVGYYKGENLLSSDINYEFSKSMRGNIKAVFKRINTVQIYDYYASLPIATLSVTDNDFTVSEYVPKDKVFYSYNLFGKTYTDINQIFNVDKDCKLFILAKRPVIEYSLNDRILNIDANTTYSLKTNDKILKENISDSKVNLAKLIGKQGSFDVTIYNDKYNINKTFNITIKNDIIFNCNLVKYNGKYYVVSGDDISNITPKIMINNSIVNVTFSSNNNISFADVTSYIKTYENTLKSCNYDSDNIMSSYTNMPSYTNYIKPTNPNINVTESTLNVTNNDDYILYFVVNGVKVSKMVANSISLKGYENSRVGVMFYKDGYTSLSEIDYGNFTGNFDSVESTMFLQNNNNIITMSAPCDEYEIIVNGVKINKRETASFDLSKLACKSGEYFVIVNGYIGGKIAYVGSDTFNYNLEEERKENFSFIKVNNGYLLMFDKVNDAKYYVNNKLVNGSAVYVDSRQCEIKLVYPSNKTIICK